MFSSSSPNAQQNILRHDRLDDERRQAVRKAGEGMSQTKMLESVPVIKIPKKRSRLQRMVDSNYFELFFAAAIVTNSFFVGLQVEYSASERTNKTPTAFYVIQYCYAIIFTSELCIRIKAAGWHFFKLDDQHVLWNYLDIFIVSSTVFESVMDTLYLTASQLDGGDDNGITSGASNARIIRILRIARLMRIIRVARILRFIHALRTFIYSIIATLKSLVWALVLLFMILYVFGIVFTQTAGDWLIDNEVAVSNASSVSETSDAFLIAKYWGSLPRSIFTLFKAISGGVSWDDVVHPVAEVGGFWVAVFTFYISFTYFAVLNVVTGIFCQSAIETAQTNEDLMVQGQINSKELYTARIKKLFNELDDDASGSLTIAELEANLYRDNVQAVFASIDIGTNDAWTLFKMLASDEGCEVTGEEFVEGLMRLKGNAKRADFVELNVLIKRLDHNFHNLVALVENVDHRVAQVSGFCHGKLFMDKDASKQATKSAKIDTLANEYTQSTMDDERSGKEFSDSLQQELWDSVMHGTLCAVKPKRQSPRLDACCGDIGPVNPTSLEEECDPLENERMDAANQSTSLPKANF